MPVGEQVIVLIVLLAMCNIMGKLIIFEDGQYFAVCMCEGIDDGE